MKELFVWVVETRRDFHSVWELRHVCKTQEVADSYAEQYLTPGSGYAPGNVLVMPVRVID